MSNIGTGIISIGIDIHYNLICSLLVYELAKEFIS